MNSKDIIELLNINKVKIKKITHKNIKNVYNDKDLSKLIFKSNNFGDFIVIDFNGKSSSGNNMFKIVFIDTYYKDSAQFSQIMSGDIKDFRAKSVCFIGILGDNYKEIKKNDKELCLKLRTMWKDMLIRCYDKNNKRYNDYGGKGVYVSKRWLNFSKFFYDIINMETYDRDKLLNGELSIDKDKLQYKLKIKKYSKKTCCLLDRKDQYKYSSFSIYNKNKRILIKYTNTLTGEIKYYLGVNELARKLNIDVSGIYSVLSGRCHTYKNFIFEYAK